MLKEFGIRNAVALFSQGSKVLGDVGRAEEEAKFCLGQVDRNWMIGGALKTYRVLDDAD